MKQAVHARAMGAGEIRLARLTGSYPVDHRALDAYTVQREIAADERAMLDEAAQFEQWFREYEHG